MMTLSGAGSESMGAARACPGATAARWRDNLQRRRLSALCAAFILSLATLCFGSAPALAQSCSTPTVSTLAFGDVTSAVLAGNSSDSTATLNYSCTGFSSGQAVRICLALGSFNASLTRTMTSASGGSLDYQIYQDAARTVRWGNATTTTIMTIDTTANASGAVSGSATLYGRVLSGQNTEPDGSYTRTMSGSTSQRLTWTTGTTACTSVTTGARQFSFSVTATISNLCTVNALTHDFGLHNDLSASRDTTSTVTARCTNTTPYSISLGPGSGAGATVAVRKMTGPASNTINYSLYRDTGRTLVWGDTIGTNTVSATGNGTNQNQTIYGRVPVQSLPDPGAYTDTVVVTVTY